MHRYALAIQAHLNALGMVAQLNDSGGKLFLVVDVPTQSPKESYGAVIVFVPCRISIFLNTQVSQWVVDNTGNSQFVAEHGFESLVGCDVSCCLHRVITTPGTPLCLIESTLWDMAEVTDELHEALAQVIHPAA